MLFSAGILAVLYVQGASAQCNKIDALTTASFQINGGEACSTSAKFDWSFTRSNGEITFDYGTTNSYGTKKAFTPNAGNKPLTISPLTPNTTYYYRVIGVYTSKNVNKEYYKSTFKTAASGVTSVGAPANGATAMPSFTLSIGDTRVTLAAVNGDAVKVALYSLDGSVVMTRIVMAGADRSVRFGRAGVTPGCYLLQVRCAGATIMRAVSVAD